MTAPTTTAPDADKPERHKDPELRAMSRILATLRELPPLAADRVLTYVTERHTEQANERANQAIHTTRTLFPIRRALDGVLDAPRRTITVDDVSPGTDSGSPF